MIRTKRKPPDERNGEYEEIREWFRWAKTTWRVAWLAIGGLVVLISLCSGALAVACKLYEIWEMLQ